MFKIKKNKIEELHENDAETLASMHIFLDETMRKGKYIIMIAGFEQLPEGMAMDARVRAENLDDIARDTFIVQGHHLDEADIYGLHKMVLKMKK